MEDYAAGDTSASGSDAEDESDKEASSSGEEEGGRDGEAGRRAAARQKRPGTASAAVAAKGGRDVKRRRPLNIEYEMEHEREGLRGRSAAGQDW